MRTKARAVELQFKHPWWHPNYGYGEQIRCMDERLVMDLSRLIRSKPDWNSKFKNDDIVSKWRSEFYSLDAVSEHKEDVFNYALRELQWYDGLENTLLKEGQFKIGPDHRIVYSDNAVASKTADHFKAEAAKFEAENPKDYHPGSNETMVDLVHPSLYHLEYGRTKILKEGKLEVAAYSNDIQEKKIFVADWGVSKRFQWLPALLKLDSETRQFIFDSYINNLHPIKYESMYGAIGKIFNQILPGLNFSLARYMSEEYVRVEIPRYTDVYNDKYSEFETRFWDLAATDDFDEEALAAEKRSLFLQFPPKYTKDPVTKDFDLRSFPNLKVVVKLANIELTPEKPKYPGGTWHVEGTINEDIVATALYYYDTDNIKGSKLSFRAAYEDPYYDQGDEEYCKHFFNLNDEDKMTSNVGSIDSIKDRVIIFPNTFQHHVDAFELEDSLKPGYRKILCFFIVDPQDDHVLSTKSVPPQQKEWVESEEIMEKFFPTVDTKDVNTLTWSEATELRDALMKERSVDEEDYDYENAYVREFSLCEH